MRENSETPHRSPTSNNGRSLNHPSSRKPLEPTPVRVTKRVTGGLTGRARSPTALGPPLHPEGHPGRCRPGLSSGSCKEDLVNIALTPANFQSSDTTIRGVHSVFSVPGSVKPSFRRTRGGRPHPPAPRTQPGSASEPRAPACNPAPTATRVPSGILRRTAYSPEHLGRGILLCRSSGFQARGIPWRPATSRPRS
jgi:hypothetical protein